jgi:hypothetical protein
MLNDRLKIAKGGGMDVMLGRQTFLNCAGLLGYAAGCDGGDPIDVRCSVFDCLLASPAHCIRLYAATCGCANQGCHRCDVALPLASCEWADKSVAWHV